MKTFLKSTKGKIILGASGAVVIGAIVTLIIILNSGFRTIMVQTFNGAVTVTNGFSSVDAFEGQKLKDGDEVDVPAKGNLTLLVDSDKYIYAEEKAHFFIEAKGTADNTRTNIRQTAGTVLYRIDNKLKDSESYTVKTSNAALSVRGTVYRVSCDYLDGYSYTKVEVFEGSVFVEAKMENGDSTNQSRLLNAGEMCIIHSNPDMSEFMVDEENNVVRLIEYNALPVDTALTLGSIIDDGRDLSITKDLLYDVVEITEHEFINLEKSVDPTCTQEGTLVEVCTICGMEKVTVLEADINEEHEYEYIEVAATCDSDGYTIKICKDCGEEVERVKTEKATPHHYGEWSIEKEATETEDGIKVSVCTDCGEKRIEVIKKTGKNDKNDNKNDDKNNSDDSASENSANDDSDDSNDSISQNTIDDTSKKEDDKKQDTVVVTEDTNNDDNSSSSSSDDDDDDDDDDDVNPCAAGHDGVIIDRVSATCQHDAYIRYRCSRCSEEWNDITGAKLPHTPEQYQDGSDILYSDASEHYSQCSVCGDRINATRHDFTHNINDNGDGATHSQQCECGETSNSESHTFEWLAFTYGHQQHCTICDGGDLQGADQHTSLTSLGSFTIPDGNGGNMTVDIQSCGVCGCTHSYSLPGDSSLKPADDGTGHCANCHKELMPE